MSSTQSENSVIAKTFGLAQQTSIVAIFGLLFAVPGLVALHFLAPFAIGFYLIAMTATIAHLQLKALNSKEDMEMEEASELSGARAALFLTILLLVAFAGVTMKLLASTALALFAFSLGNDAVLAVLLAIVFPVFDREIADKRWYTSIAGISGIGLLLVIISILRGIATVNDISSESLRSISNRLIV